MAGEIRVLVKSQADNSGFKQAENDAENFGRKMTAASAIATGGLIALGGAAIKMAADFEHSIDQVGAVAGATAAEMDALGAKAKQIGADSAYSASQAAGAMEELAANGLTAADIMNGAADAAVNLAAAGGTTLPNAAKIASTAMAAFNLDASKMTDVVNRIAGAANTSRFGVEDMGQAVAAAGGVAATYGVEFKELAAAVTATASSFSSGSDAGTSFKTFLNSLSGNSKEAKETIESLGLEFFNAQNQLKPLSEIVGELNTKLSGLDERARTDALKTIFGSDAFRTAAGLMKMTKDEFEALMTSMGNTDAAAVAATRMDNAKGSVEALKGSMETLGIAVGEKAIPALAGAAEGATKAVNAFAALPESTQGLALGFTAVAVAAPAAVAAVGKVADSVKALRLAMAGTGATPWGAIISGAALGIGALAVGVDGLLQKTSGAGVIDYLMRSADGVKAAKEFNRELEHMASIAKGAGVAFDPIVAATEQWQKAAENWKGGRQFQEDANKLAGATKAYAEAMMAANATVWEMAAAQKAIQDAVGGKALDGGISDFGFGKQADLAEKLALATKEAGRAMAESQNDYYKLVEASDALAAGALDAGKNTLFLRDSVPQAKDALAEFNAGLEETDNRADKLAERLGLLSQKFSTLSPEYQKNAIQLAILKDEIADMKEAGETYSMTLGMTVTEMEAAAEAIEKTNGAADRNAETVHNLSAQWELLSGSAGMVSGGYLKVEQALSTSNLSLAGQSEAVKIASLALTSFADNDLPNTAKKLLELGKVAPEAMKAFIDGIADPAVKARLITVLDGIANDAGQAMYTAWYGAAGLALKGFTEGLANADNVYYAAKAAADRASEGLTFGLNMESPSKLWRKYGRQAIEGFVLGLDDGATDMTAAGARAATLASRGVLEANRVVIVGGVPVVGPATGPAAPKPPPPPKQPPIIAGVPVPAAPKPGDKSALKPNLVPVGNGVYWNTETGQFETHITDLGGGAMWDGTDLVTAPGGYQNQEKVYTDGKGNWYWTLDDSLAWSATSGSTSTAGFNAVHGRNDILDAAARQAKGLPINPQTDSNWWYSQENMEKAMADFHANWSDQVNAWMDESSYEYNNATTWSIFEDPYLAGKAGVPTVSTAKPPQWMIDAPKDEYGSPVWAKYGWTYSPWTGYMNTITGEGGSGQPGPYLPATPSWAMAGAGYDPDSRNAEAKAWASKLSGASLASGSSGGGYSGGGGGGGGNGGGSNYYITIQTFDNASLEASIPKLVAAIERYESRSPRKVAVR